MGWPKVVQRVSFVTPFKLLFSMSVNTAKRAGIGGLIKEWTPQGFTFGFGMFQTSCFIFRKKRLHW
jgi:hypothetical protein